MNFINLSRKTKESLIQLKNVLLIILIIIDLIFIIVISFFNIDANDLIFMAYFDLVVCVILFLNLISSYFYSDESLTKFLKSHIIDFISIIPFNFIFLRYLTIFRIFRILQVLQVVRVFNIKKLNDESFRYFIHNRLLKILTLIVIVYMVLASCILYAVDNSFSSIFNAFWYNMATFTAVGYGDITPVSYQGKIIGILTILMGVFFISIFTAAMSAVYMEKPENETRNIIKTHINKLEEENISLREDVERLERETHILNKKIDKLINKLNKE